MVADNSSDSSFSTFTDDRFSIDRISSSSLLSITSLFISIAGASFSVFGFFFGVSFSTSGLSSCCLTSDCCGGSGGGLSLRFGFDDLLGVVVVVRIDFFEIF